MGKFIKKAFSNKNSLFKKIKYIFKHREPLRYMLYRIEWRTAPWRERARPFPVHLGIEPTNHCNLNCVFCARHNIDYKFGFMDFNLYKKIIDEGASLGLRSVKLVRGGDDVLCLVSE